MVAGNDATKASVPVPFHMFVAEDSRQMLLYSHESIWPVTKRSVRSRSFRGTFEHAVSARSPNLRSKDRSGRDSVIWDRDLRLQSVMRVIVAKDL